MPATQASAINEVACTQSDFLTIVHWQGRICYANAGDDTYGIDGVKALSSGNNAGYISGTGSTTFVGFEKFTTWSSPGWGTVRLVHIN
jgi:hypothetical protein